MAIALRPIERIIDSLPLRQPRRDGGSQGAAAAVKLAGQARPGPATLHALQPEPAVDDHFALAMAARHQHMLTALGPQKSGLIRHRYLPAETQRFRSIRY